MTKPHQSLLDFIADLRAAGVTSYVGSMDGWSTTQQVSLTLDPLWTSAPQCQPGPLPEPKPEPRKLTPEELQAKEDAEYIPGAD